MDWIRRNWPDLLIAIALVAVIAGIIATLLSGGSLWPTSRGGGNQQLSQGRSVVNGNGNAPINLRGSNSGNNNASGLSLGNAPTASTLNRNNVEVVSPGLASGATNGNTVNGSNLNGGLNNGATLAAPLGSRNNNLSLAAPLNNNVGNTAGNAVGSPRTGSSISADINNTAGRGLSIGNNGASANTGNVANVGGVVSTNGVTIPNNANAASNAGSQQLAGRTTFATPQAITVNPANASASAGGSYKISVGAFGVAANAQNLANQLNQQGYPVGFDQQGSLNVVYVGPFASQAEADAVAGQLRQAGQATSVYADPQARANVQQNVTSAQAGQVRQQNFQQQPAVASQNVAPASVGRSYLQVGAYNDVTSSLTQRSRLESLGLTVYDRREGGFVKLIVGPFADNEVGIYRSQLRDRGIDSFPVN